MSIVTIEQRDLIKSINKKVIGDSIENSNNDKQESNSPMVSVSDGSEKGHNIDYICYNGRWFSVVPLNDQKRLAREWEEREIK